MRYFINLIRMGFLAASGLWLVWLGGCESAAGPCLTGKIAQDPGPCGHGLAVVNTDYIRSELTVLGLDGQILSQSLLPSAQDPKSGGPLLSGDLIVPLSPSQGGEIVVIDRSYGKINWIDPFQARVIHSAETGIEFKSNPHDYLKISAEKAYVSRYEPNTKPNQKPLDEGSDILIIDPADGQMLGRIDLTPAMAGEDPAFFPRPDRMLRAGDRVYTLLQGYSLDFVESAESRVAVIDIHTDSIIDVFILKGLHGCGAMDISPQQSEIAIGCSGEFAGDSLPTLDQSGLALLSLGSPMTEIKRWMASEFGAGAIGLSLAYVADGRIVFSTLGFADYMTGNKVNDLAIELDMNTNKFDTLIQSEPFSLGDVRCAAACSACFIADTAVPGVHRFLPDSQLSLKSTGPVPIQSCSGHPPRFLGIF